MIGIGVTVHNRRDISSETVRKIKERLPHNSKMVVVDDCSDDPFSYSDYRFERNAGINVAKNKCLQLLEDCEHIFLFDDDTFPIVDNWWEPYINSGQMHLLYNFSRSTTDVFKRKNGLRIWTCTRGCMLYIRKEVLDKVGGMDKRYIQYGLEHIGFTYKIHNLGLTEHLSMDVDEKVIHCLDEDNIKSSVSRKDRIFETNNRLILFDNKINPLYNDYSDPVYRDAILTCYFSLSNDPQRNVKWSKSMDRLMPLINSCRKFNIDLKIFYDSINQSEIDREFYGNVEFIRMPPIKNFVPNTWRRIVFHEYLKYRHHPRVFMVDSTDVEVLKKPFDLIEENKLYVGNELRSVDNTWMRGQEKLLKIPDYRQVISKYANRQLPNAGIIGGYYDTVLDFTKKNSELHREYSENLTQTTDMSVFNYTVWKYFEDKMVMGDFINTPFKKETYTDAWFKHK